MTDYFLLPMSALPFPNIDPVILRLGPVAIHWYGLGYVVGTDLEAATGFLGSLATMIVALLAAGWALYLVARNSGRRAGI